MLGNVQTRERQSDAPYLMRTNTAGFRTREIEAKRRPGTRRVLFYGDSFTEGVGVSDGHRFTDLLETLIPDTEVLNFGVRATGTDQQLLFFRERPADLDYDLVVIGLYTGDVKRNNSKYGVLTSTTGASYEKPFFRLDGDDLVLENVPVPTLAADYGNLDKDERELVYNAGLAYRLRVAVRQYAPWAKTALQRVTRYQPAPFLKSADDPAWLLTRGIVNQWASEAATPVLVLAIPPYQYLEGTASSSAYRERYREMGRDLPVTVHDPLDDLKAAAKIHGAKALRIRGDAHYSAKGHEVLAESFAPVISGLLPAPESIGDDRS